MTRLEHYDLIIRTIGIIFISFALGDQLCAMTSWFKQRQLQRRMKILDAHRAAIKAHHETMAHPQWPLTDQAGRNPSPGITFAPEDKK